MARVLRPREEGGTAMDRSMTSLGSLIVSVLILIEVLMSGGAEHHADEI